MIFCAFSRKSRIRSIKNGFDAQKTSETRAEIFEIGSADFGGINEKIILLIAVCRLLFGLIC